MSRILPLPPDAIAQIGSSKNITSLQGVVLSLLENSLDAGASKVEITFDPRRGNCCVEDNGHGVPSDEFLEHGGLGRMYHTSKRDPASVGQQFHGSKGTYLASLAALSMLSVTSRHAQGNDPATIVLHQGKVIARDVPAPPAHELSPPNTHGTRVTVKDLFGNIPVRVKQRSLAVDSNSVDEKAWQEAKHGTVALLLSWRHPCSVRFRDAEAGIRDCNLFGLHPSVSTMLTKKSLNQLGGKFTRFELKDALPIMLQAGLAPLDSRDLWIPVSASALTLSVRGAICQTPAPTKQCQFISIGVHPCDGSSGQNDLYDVVNKVFGNSSFGSPEDDADVSEAEQDRRKRDRRYKNDGYTQRQLRSGKNVDRWPMFVLQVTFQNQNILPVVPENLSDRILKAVEDVLKTMVTQWLSANHFCPRKRQARKNDNQQAPAFTSSSPRPSSRIQTCQTRPRYPKRAATTLEASFAPEKRTFGKRAKVLDVTGKAHSFSPIRPVSAQDESSHFGAWSRIRSGNDSFYGEAWQKKRNSTAPAGQTGSTSEGPKPASRKVAFDSPIIEIGGLNRPKTPTVPGVAREAVTAHASRQPENSSDDFGSCDESEMLALGMSAEDPSQALGYRGAVDEVQGTQDESMHRQDDATVDWTDPITKQSFQVNSRTGVVLPTRPVISSARDVAIETTRQSAPIDTSLSSAGRPLSLARRSAVSDHQKPDKWLPGFLKEWDNPVFAPQDEKRIPVTSLDGVSLVAEGGSKHRCSDRSNIFREAGTPELGQLSKNALKDIVVIKQVDQKYILCKTRPTENSTAGEMLLLVDQHAASERVILETLLSELCTSDTGTIPASSSLATSRNTTHPLSKPLLFEVSGTEHELFRDHAGHFAAWGILYELPSHCNATTASQVRPAEEEHLVAVRHLPPAIAERCTLVPKLLIDLLRAEIWSLADAGKSSNTTHQASSDATCGDDYWLRQIGSCPKGLLDMVNSRACRSAIMFNDRLSNAQCEELLGRLRQTKFPFMCAHGRVSMVPVVRMGGESDSGGQSGIFASEYGEGAGSGFATAFRASRARE